MEPLFCLSIRSNTYFSVFTPSLYKSLCKRLSLHIRKPNIRIIELNYTLTMLLTSEHRPINQHHDLST
jgi:hypothetical protein